MPNLLTFGDSNTHGTLPLVIRGRFERYDAGVRWPTRAAALLGPDWHLAEEGLPGRTTSFPDPVMGAHLDGQLGLRIALQSHGPLDVMTLMLGTNDVKLRFGATPERVLGGIASLVDMAFAPDMASRHPGLKILLICPPPVQEAGVLAGDYLGARSRSRALSPLYRDYAERRGIGFLDAGQHVEVSPVDGVHFAPEGHGALAAAVADALRALVR